MGDAWHVKVFGAVYGVIGAVHLFAPQYHMKQTFPSLTAGTKEFLMVRQMHEAAGMGIGAACILALTAATTTPKEKYADLCKGALAANTLIMLGVAWHSSKPEYGPVPPQ